MMTRSMEVLYQPSPYFQNPTCILGREGNGSWTQQENKKFENALALVDLRTAEGWEKVAAMTGRSVRDVMSRYRVLEIDVGKIEAGEFPFTGYRPSSFTLDWEADRTGQPYCVGAKRPACGRMADQERKKGVPWTEEEHKLFLMGLKNTGKEIGEIYLGTSSSRGLLLRWLAMRRSTSSDSTRVAKIRGEPASTISRL
ncbi:transcription factor DIVARICATA-like [Iris pallida]|uniref:Transcription factor DIVARICATA-like n=1 Tax=Iris pallida TaxID=29817 RepID=A0AAX6GW06_IRIPA|nr:transcription factor DIVARICATA-like [Iris pallida]